jgi:hypothetical protein
MSGAIPPLLQYAFMAWCSVKAQGKLYLNASRRELEPTQSPIQQVPAALSAGLKRTGRETDPSPLTSVEVKKVWSCTFSLPYSFMAWCLIKQEMYSGRENHISTWQAETFDLIC